MTESKNESTDETGIEPGNVVTLPSAPADANAEERPVTRFVRQHPIAVIAGGLVVGLAAAALIPKNNRKRVTRAASNWADIAGTASMAVARQALEKAEAASQEVRNQANILATRAGQAGDDAMRRVGKVGDAASQAANRVNPFHKSQPKTFAQKLSAFIKGVLPD